jgi:T5SS/PEP-CTERM-associated repeat protein
MSLDEAVIEGVQLESMAKFESFGAPAVPPPSINSTGTIFVGSSGQSNRFDITAGAVTSATVIVGSSSVSGHNELFVSGPMSSLEVQGQVQAGAAGSFNRLLADQGASIHCIDVFSSFISTSIENTIEIRNGALLDGSGSFILGISGQRNGISISQGGRAQCFNGSIGGDPTASMNFAEVSGAGSSWDLAGDLTIGAGGPSNTLHVSSNGIVNVDDIFVGISASASANQVHFSSGASVTGTGAIVVGAGGAGCGLTVDDASVQVGALQAGPNTGADDSTASVENGGMVSVAGQILVGGAGNRAQFQVTSGGSVDTTGFSIGTDAAATGSCVEVAGGVLVVENDTDNAFMSVQHGSAHLRSNGQMIVDGFLLVDHQGGAGGLLEIEDGNLLVSNAGGTAAMEVRGGTARIRGGQVTADQLFLQNPAGAVSLEGGSLATRTSFVNNGSPFVVGDGAGAPATLNLLGGVQSFAGGVTIALDGILKGNATVFATVDCSGRIEPGTSPGSLNFSQNLTLQNSSSMEFELGGYDPITGYDVVGVTGTCTLDGLINVLLLESFVQILTNGASFAVLTAGSLAGEYDNAPAGGTVATADGYGEFTMSYAGNAVTLTGLSLFDSDGDGMTDFWEDTFGLNPTNAADAQMDADGDKFKNVDEFNAGTNPTIGTSLLEAVAISPEGDDVRVTWTTANGRDYVLEAATNSASGPYSAVSSVIPGPPSGESTTNHLDVGGALGSPAKGYRVTVEP